MKHIFIIFLIQLLTYNINARCFMPINKSFEEIKEYIESKGFERGVFYPDFHIDYTKFKKECIGFIRIIFHENGINAGVYYSFAFRDNVCNNMNMVYKILSLAKARFKKVTKCDEIWTNKVDDKLYTDNNGIKAELSYIDLGKIGNGFHHKIRIH